MIGRIKSVRKDNKVTQAKFAESLGLTANYIAQVEAGNKHFSDRTISDICRIYHINEYWLRTGEGEMHIPVDNNEQLAAMLGDFLRTDEGTDDLKERKRRFIGTLLRMTPDEWDVLLKIAESLQ